MTVSVLSAARLFVKKCIDNFNEVIALTQKKIQDPSSLVSFELSGALVDAAKEGMGSLASFGANYVERNAAALAIQALEATGLADEATQALNNFYRYMGSAVSAYNDLILLFTKKTAQTVMKEIEFKKEIRTNLLKELNAYLNTLEQMREGPSVFDEYLNELRKAMVLINKANKSLNIVLNNYVSTERFLNKPFEEAKKYMDEAAGLVKPSDNPYLDPDFLTNQTIFDKKTTGDYYIDVVTGKDGKVDPGNFIVLEGNFSACEVGDFIDVSYTEDPSIINPINEGRYQIEKVVSGKKVQLSSKIIEPIPSTPSSSSSSEKKPPQMAALTNEQLEAIQDTPFASDVAYQNTQIIFDKMNEFSAGDKIAFTIEGSPTPIYYAVVKSQIYDILNPFDVNSKIVKKLKSLVLDKAFHPSIFTTKKEKVTASVEIYKMSTKGKVHYGNGDIVQGDVIQLPKGKPIYIYNQASLYKSIISDVEYRVIRKDGIRVDGKTLYDSQADFSKKNIVGQFVKITSPKEIAGSYKIVKKSKNTLELNTTIPVVKFNKDGVKEVLAKKDGPVNGVKELDVLQMDNSRLANKTPRTPVFSVEYEVKADLGVPLDADQFSNILAIPIMTERVLLKVKAYFKHTLKANAGLEAFVQAVDTLLSGMPDIMKDYVIGLLDKSESQTAALVEGMATVLNGNPKIVSATSSFKPSPVKASAQSFKWLADIHLVRGLLKFVPAESLSKIELSKAPLDFYKSTVLRIQNIDNYRSGTAQVKGEDGREDLGQLEQQLFTLFAQGNTMIFSSSMRDELIALGKSIVRNLELAQKRDTDVYNALDAWVKFPIPEEDLLKRIDESLGHVIRALNLDRLHDLYESGMHGDMLSIKNGKAATYVGAALTALALLKECFDTPEDSDQLDIIVRELEKEEQLLDVKFSINFDLAIFKKIQECLNFQGLSFSLNLKEIFCGLANEARKSSVGQSIDSLLSSSDTGTSSPAEKTAGNLTDV